MLIVVAWIEVEARIVVSGTRIGHPRAMTRRVRQWCDLSTVDCVTLRGVRTQRGWDTAPVLWSRTPWARPRGAGWRTPLAGTSQRMQDNIGRLQHFAPLYPLVMRDSRWGPACRRDSARVLGESGKQVYR